MYDLKHAGYNYYMYMILEVQRAFTLQQLYVYI